MDKCFIPAIKTSTRSFTLVELIIVVIIVGILASLGLTQYSLLVEKSRTAEAKVGLGVMRDIAYEYYLNNGDMSTITNADVGVSNVCTADSFYSYRLWGTSTFVNLHAERCTSGGKNPNASRTYDFGLQFTPGTGATTWYCDYPDNGSGCFGLPAGI